MLASLGKLPAAVAPVASHISRLASGLQHPSPGLTLEKLELEKAEPLRLEIEDFLRAVRSRTKPRVSGQDGRNALALALEVNRQIAEHAHRTGLI
jgi:predicted dehydrogenase